MKNKTIFMFDLDGTLLSDTDFQIPTATLNFLKKIKKEAGELAINTGRPFEIINTLFHKETFNLFSIVVGYNGSYIKNETATTKHNLKYSFVKKFISENSEKTITISVGNKLYTNDATNSEEIIKRIKPEVVPLTLFTSEYDAYTIRIICKDESETKEVFKSLKNKYEATHDITMSTGVFILITKKGINKATVVNELIRQGNKVVYFGDSHNDLSVFNIDEVFKVAPANAYDVIKQRANLVLETNNDETLEFDLELLNTL